MRSAVPDIQAFDHGTFLELEGLTVDGCIWIHDKLHAVVLIDHRFGPDILAGALEDGLYVTLDGREPIGFHH